jgi:hypothetical protein
MFGLPLVCKSCGRRLELPPPQPDLPPVPVAPPVPPPVPHVGTPGPNSSAHHLGAHAPGSPNQPKPDVLDKAFLTPETWAKLDVPLEVTPGAPPAKGAEPPSLPVPPVAPKPWGEVRGKPPAAAPPAGRNLIAVVADVAVTLVLLALGALLGEFAAHKSTREVLATAAAPKFPPTELLLWLAGPVLLLLIYAFLGTRGKTVGGWLRRRGA